jgi:hypothetical protein
MLSEHTPAYNIPGHLNYQFGLLRSVIKSFTENDIIKVPPTGKWSVHNNLAHLTRYHQVFMERIDNIIKNDRPLVARYIAETDPAFPFWQTLPLEDLLYSLEQERGKLIARYRSLNKDDLRREGIHPKLGVLTLNEWFDFFLLHESHHLYTIFQLLRSES